MKDLSKKDDPQDAATSAQVLTMISKALSNVGAGSSIMVGSGPPAENIPGVGIYIDADTGQMYRQD